MDINFSQYKDSLGIPGKGFHTHILGVAWRDVVATIVGGLILALIFKWNILYTIIVLFILGILLHHLFGVKTTADKFLFS
jgi:hypothetical protein